MFQATGTCGTTIAPSQACTLVVSFTPAVPILYRGVLILFDNARPRPVQVYRLSGQGTGSGAAARTGAEDAISAPKGSVRSTAETQAAVSPRTREVAPGGQQQGSMVLTGEAPESVGCEDLNAIGSDERSLDSLLKAAENCRL